MSWPTLTDYQETIQNPRLCFADSELQNCLPEMGLWNLPKAMSGNFAVVFQVKCNGHKYAVKCFTTYHPDQEQRYAMISSYLNHIHLPYIVHFEFIKQGIKIGRQWYPILKMEWIDGEELHQYIKRNIGNPQTIQNLTQRFIQLISDLRRYSIAHGDLQNRNILIVNGDFRLIDYDGMYVPDLKGMLSHEIGHPNFQHPRRSEKDFGPYLDNFSAWVIYISLMALSTNPNLWYRFGADDEHLLFRRRDFENPDLSEVLHALEQVRDGTVKSLISSFRSFMYLDLSQIPSLDRVQLTQVISTQVSTTTQPSLVTDYVNFQSPAQATNPSSLDPGHLWILDYMEPLSPIRMSTTSYIPERLFLTVFAVIGALSIYTTIDGLVAPIIAVSAICGGFALLLLMLTLRFRFISEVSQKFKLLSSSSNLQKEIKKIESTIKRLNDDKNKLDKEGEQKIRDITSNQGKCAQKEKNEINKIEHELQGTLTKIKSQRQSLSQVENKEIEKINFELRDTLTKLNSQRQVLNQAENNEIAQALRDLQSQFFNSNLAKYDLNSANIPGIGSELTKRLVDKGIRTAADIINVHIMQTGLRRYSHETAYIEVSGRGLVYVEGIGPKKAKALLSWRRSLESKFRSHMPLSLTTAQEAAIKSKYQIQHQLLDRQENDARQNARQKEAAIKSKYQSQYQQIDLQETNAKENAKQKKIAVQTKYQQEQNVLTKQLQDIQVQATKRRQDLDQKINELRKSVSEKYWVLAKVRRELNAYKQVNFGVYLKRILLRNVT